MGPVTRRQVVFSDASSVGWGVVHEGCGVTSRCLGPWLSRHINVLELQAAFLALQLFLPRLQGFHIIVRTDSTVAASYINRQGGLGSPPLCNMAKRLLVVGPPPVPLPQGGPRAWTPEHGSRHAVQGGPCPGEW